MNPIQHPSNNAVLSAPAGWDQSELPVSALAITRTAVEGTPAVVSFWKPTAEELALLNAGGCVGLCVLGQSMPPVSLEVMP
ncbi:hypothetical protein ACU4HD_11980 [Cupriavidus basilensis]